MKTQKIYIRKPNRIRAFCDTIDVPQKRAITRLCACQTGMIFENEKA
jgi:hypothetical protein